MPSYDYPLFTEWISQPILSVVTAPLCDLFQKIVAKEVSQQSAVDMNFIDISSSDSDDETLTDPGSSGRNVSMGNTSKPVGSGLHLNGPGYGAHQSAYTGFPGEAPPSSVVGSSSGSRVHSSHGAGPASGFHNGALNGEMHGGNEWDDLSDSFIDGILNEVDYEDNESGIKVPSPEIRKRALPPSFHPQSVSSSLSRPSSQAYEKPSQVLHHETDLQLGPSSSSKPDFLNEKPPPISYDYATKPSDKRVLPPSFQPIMTKPTPSTSKDRGGKQFQSNPLKIDDSTGSQSINRCSAIANRDARDDDEVYIYGEYKPCTGFGSSGHAGAVNIPIHPGPTMMGVPTTQNNNIAGAHRVLPAWMVGKTDIGKFATTSQSSDQHNFRDHTGMEDFGPIEHDERLVYESVLEDISQPKKEAAIPDGLLSVPLLKHQKIALAWLVQKEVDSKPCSGGILADDQGLGKTVSMIALILKQMPQQKTFTSHRAVNMITEPVILDEDDNTVIEEKKSAETDQPKLAPTFQKGRPAAGSLVVCPASVLRQWARELDDKVSSSAKLSVLIYYGSSRKKEPVELAKYDVVLTTYTIITNEVPKQPLADENGDGRRTEDYGLTPDFAGNNKRKPMSTETNKRKKKKKKGTGVVDDFGVGPLAKVRWFRVILDEAQVIKNFRTQVARACCGLRAKQRWCLSGTPLQNTIDDLYSYFRFLKYEPYATYSAFYSALKGPIIRNGATGYKKLQVVLGAVMLRRTKGTKIDGKPIVALPPKSILLKELHFSMEERSFYVGLEANYRARFMRYNREGTLKQNYANLLLMLLRLRQACDHPMLVKDYDSETSDKTSLETAKKLSKEIILNLLKLLEDSCPICIICNDPAEDAVVSTCTHIFCYQCILERLSAEESMCPAANCSNMLSTDSIFSKGILRCCVLDDLKNDSKTMSEDYEESGSWGSGFVSTKVSAVLEILNSVSAKHASQKVFCDGFEKKNFASDSSSAIASSSSDLSAIPCIGVQSDIPPKAIIFSQWTSMLDLLESSLNHDLIQYRRLDGSMTLASREQAVKEFNTDPEVTVMLMSLKAGNLGLNMIAACHVILVDLWWNPTSEDQAIDRAHRIGQTRPVTVHRLTVEDTVEQRILKLQEQKRDMVSSAFGEDSTGKATTRLTLEDLRFLFRV